MGVVSLEPFASYPVNGWEAKLFRPSLDTIFAQHVEQCIEAFERLMAQELAMNSERLNADQALELIRRLFPLPEPWIRSILQAPATEERERQAEERERQVKWIRELTRSHLPAQPLAKTKVRASRVVQPQIPVVAMPIEPMAPCALTSV